VRDPAVSDTTPIIIHFVGAPVQLMQAVRLHLEALTREFQLIEFAADDASSPPARLLELTSRMRREYDEFGFATSREELTDALDRGTDTIDLELVVPPVAGTAVQLFLRTMDETDEWCERGELLTLASPPEQRALRRWFFGEIERQVRGEAPLPWGEFVDADPTR
jgi:hypothetical protein